MTATTTVSLEEHPKYVILDESKWTLKAESTHKGPSPWATTPNEGASVQRTEAPLKPSGALDQYKYTDLTPVIGREYHDIQLAEILDDDDKIRDLAINIAYRGVAFFRGQKITVEQQKVLAQKLTSLTFQPKTSSLHIHPITPGGGFLRPDGSIDPEVTLISSEYGKKVYHKDYKENKALASKGIHQDFAFETIPSAFSILKIIEPLETGGDTLWWSGAGLYDKLSDPFKRYLETLTGTFSGNQIGTWQEKFKLFNGPR
ncbi:hypothetical protein AWJ20_332 [Sugiyamaella lignohabitans]|uniref:TauD/TfdA-like domain-containing protein n=1 Tax=Sugiyamaella lignohabitans TaxID=796027 RepID=A0A161HI66_9ASCO|nr:uncharacterized protein AWJ20_332 [Sugiyamaella lignohabitans]ANB12097.1 hypothetical protein AWJ20_332 [Sugiyamaella lignohabitans]